MRLISLEIHGFKSFPDKTILNFNEPVTAIVGPNGSGKSNISDALRWVMGEQSNKALRGAKMEDVVFGGSAGRAPSGFAQVTMTLDNEDGALSIDAPQVAVSRRVYRSGESEFFINKKSVRLKDVHDLFMDTGLGRDGYSIIGQGRIDEILSAKSTQRRELFEEAAGISRYRYRKEEAQRRLEAAAANLLRIDDKIQELELSIGPLREQSAVAEKYLGFKDELKGLECAVWLKELETADDQVRESAENAKIARDQLTAAKAALEELYRLSGELDRSGEEKRAAADTLRQRIRTAESEGTALSNEAALLRRDAKSLEESAERAERDMAERRERKVSLERQTSLREDELGELAALKEKLTAEAAALIEKADSDLIKLNELKTALEAKRGAREAISTSCAALEAKLESLKSAEERRKLRREELEERLREAAGRLDEARAEAESAEAELSSASKSVEDKKKTLGELLSKEETAAREAENARAQTERKRDELRTLTSRYTALYELEREYDGYSRAVKKVMQESGRGTLRGVHGPVSRLLHVKEPYVTAIQTALSSQLQNIIVDTQEDGKRAIELLKRTDSGRATFYPLDAMEGSEMSAGGLKSEEGFIGIASSLVSFEPQYAGIFRNLLGRTVVAENLDCAIRISRRQNNRLRIVTLDGQMLNAGGSMTGGSAARTGGILSRAAELEKLKGETEQRGAALKQLEERFKELLDAKNAASDACRGASEELRSAEDTALKLEGRLREKKAVLNAAENSFRELAASSSTESTESEGYTEEARLQQEKLTAKREELRAAEEELEKSAAAAREAEDSQAELNTRIGSCAASLREAEAKENAAEALIAEYREQINEIDRFCADRTEEIKSAARRKEELRQSAGEKETRAEEKAGEASALTKELDSMTASAREDESRRAENQRDIQSRSEEIITLERQCGRLEAKSSAAQMIETQITDKLWESYGLTRSSAAPEAAVIGGMNTARQQIGTLKSKIAKLGEVNVGAIAEYRRVSDRYEYLTGQRDDAASAKKELETLIGSISSDMKTVFVEQFNYINEKFGETFAEIFGGGTASVHLEDPNDVLECGIEIRVQPPGKKVRTLSLLSGGERAFAAIALYFAIIKVRPTPFCIMDEIETALDEVNSVRFANYLRYISKKTQMLVITHRRPTMEAAGILYGVTMQTKGVSKVLTLALDEVEEQLRLHI